MPISHELCDAIADHDLEATRLHYFECELNEAQKTVIFHSAVVEGSVEIVQFFLDQGYDINIKSGAFRGPALTYVAYNGYLQMVQFLLDSGAVADVSSFNRNPLICAARNGHQDVVEYLLTTDIDPNACYRHPSGKLKNALTGTEEKGHDEIVDLLKAHGARHPIEGVDIPLSEPRKRPTQEQTSQSQQALAVVSYMEDRFGPADENGMRELVPLVPDLSVTINIIPPNNIHPFYVLFTNGMSARPLNVPKGQEAWQYAEVVMQLPPDWVHPRDSIGNAQWLWPVQQLRNLAYTTHSNQTWLGYPGAIVSTDDPPKPLGPGMKQTCLFLLPDFSNLKPPLHLPDGRPVHFYTATPLYTEERDFELKHGMGAFLDKLVSEEVPLTVDPARPCFA